MENILYCHHPGDDKAESRSDWMLAAKVALRFLFDKTQAFV
jgi:hypothetical protein